MSLFTYPASSVAIAGVATEAKQDTQITNQGTIITSLGVIESDTSSIDGKITAVDTDNVTISSALPTGANTIGNVNVNAITDVDFLDAGVVDSSSTNIPAAGLAVVASLNAACTEIEVVEDIGEFMVLTDGSDTILAYLPLGGGRVKVSIAATTALKLASVSGSTISLGKIAINFLG